MLDSVSDVANKYVFALRTRLWLLFAVITLFDNKSRDTSPDTVVALPRILVIEAV
jgi:hypothetical protein